MSTLILPNVNVAAWCEAPRATDKPPEVIRTLRIWPPLGEPEIVPGASISLHFALSLYGGEIEGTRTVRLVLFGPSGPYNVENDLEMRFHPRKWPFAEGLIIVTFFPRTTGRSWGVLDCDGAPLTRVPIYLRVEGSTEVVAH